MDHPLIDLISAKIRAAEAEGAFDNLPGAGKPLPDRDPSVDGVMNRIMQENGAEPAFVSLSRELAKLRAELLETSDRTERRRLMTQMSMLQTKLELARNG